MAINAETNLQQIPGFFSIDWDRVGFSTSELGDLSDDKKGRLNKAVTRMNQDLLFMRQNQVQIDKQYYDFARDVVGAWADTADWDETRRKNTAITIAEETFVLDREKARTYYEQNVAAQIFAPITRGLNRFKWDIKHYLIKKVANVVKQSRSFDNPRFIKLETEGQMDKGMGWYCGYQISRWDLLENQGELFDIQYEHMLEAAAQMGRFANQHILTGSTVQHGGTDDVGEAGSGMGLTGFLNHASVQTHTVSTLTTFGNIYKGIKAGLTNLKKAFATPTRIMITSAGIPDQADSNFATYEARNEYDEILKRLVGPGKPVQQWWVTDFITGAAISNSTQKMSIVAMDPRLMSRLIVLPLQTLPSNTKNWRDDISEVMLAGDILRFNNYNTDENVFPVTNAASLTTTGEGILTHSRIA